MLCGISLRGVAAWGSCGPPAISHQGIRECASATAAHLSPGGRPLGVHAANRRDVSHQGMRECASVSGSNPAMTSPTIRSCPQAPVAPIKRLPIMASSSSRNGRPVACSNDIEVRICCGRNPPQPTFSLMVRSARGGQRTGVYATKNESGIPSSPTAPNHHTVADRPASIPSPHQSPHMAAVTV